MKTGVLIAIIIAAVIAIGGAGYGIWYAVSRGGGSSGGSSPMAYSVPPFGISSGPSMMGPSPQQQQPPASFAQAKR